MRRRDEFIGVEGKSGAIVVGVDRIDGKVGVRIAKGWERSSVRLDIVDAELGRAGVMLMERGVSGEDAR